MYPFITSAPQAAPIGQHQGPVILDAQGIPRLLAGDLEKLSPLPGCR